MLLLQTHTFFIRLNLTSETEGTAVLSCFQTRYLSSKKFFTFSMPSFSD